MKTKRVKPAFWKGNGRALPPMPSASRFLHRTTKSLNEHPRLNDFQLNPRVTAIEVTIGNRVHKSPVRDARLLKSPTLRVPTTSSSPSMNLSYSGESADPCPPLLLFDVSGCTLLISAHSTLITESDICQNLHSIHASTNWLYIAGTSNISTSYQ